MKKFLSKRGQVSDFIVMDLFEEARNLAKKGKNIIHFEAGQPTNKLPRTAFTEAINKIKTTNVSYTSPLGLDLLKKKIAQHGSKVYLVNTGWIGGSASSGAKRISIQNTRAMITAILDGSIEKSEFKIEPVFNLSCPLSLKGVCLPALIHPGLSPRADSPRFVSRR